MRNKPWRSQIEKKNKVRKCCHQWSAYMKGVMLNNRMHEHKQEAEVKYYQQG